MATWMMHLRVAKGVQCAYPQLSFGAFAMGNIAPDSGVPNTQGTDFEPAKSVSHFQDQDKLASPSLFAEKYLDWETVRRYDLETLSFFLGYLSHLITDRLWSQKIARPCLRLYSEAAYIPLIKKDWYDLDFLFLKRNPGFSPLLVLKGYGGFSNCYMEEFGKDAFDNRRNGIISFYTEFPKDLERSYNYLTEAEADAFAEDAISEVNVWLHRYLEYDAASPRY